MRFQKQTLFPKAVDAHALTIHSRRVAAALARAQEIKRTHVWGVQVQRTWQQLLKVTPSLPEHSQAQFAEIVRRGLTAQAIDELIPCLQSTLASLKLRDHRERIKAWKRRLQQSQKQAYKWLRNETADADISMKMPDGTYTANYAQQLNAVAEAWLPIIQKFANDLPDLQRFNDCFVPHMKTCPMTLPHVWRPAGPGPTKSQAQLR